MIINTKKNRVIKTKWLKKYKTMNKYEIVFDLLELNLTFLSDKYYVPVTNFNIHIILKSGIEICTAVAEEVPLT